MGLRIGHRFDDAAEFFGTKSRPAMGEVLKAIDAIIARESLVANQVAADAKEKYRFSVRALTALGIVTMLVCTMVALIITKSVKKPLTEALAIADAVAAGDISAEVKVLGTDETGRLLEALVRMNEKLTSIVSQVRDSANAVTRASRALAKGNRMPFGANGTTSGLS
ncbi:HAMP domain-containing protein [Herbaspirillum seropedicae]|uniref:HAMP domain-containing protein n=1 Tax=Herbaspirillum seropedicae TaxID=964 RepID=UPI00285BC151|nr:HAMP domain-containing protein [Herbaspirillum seropedicae]MDR6397527.1 methyl-accepting chemotaxis protein [Herbaspirillum seropedicae]